MSGLSYYLLFKDHWICRIIRGDPLLYFTHSGSKTLSQAASVLFPIIEVKLTPISTAVARHVLLIGLYALVGSGMLTCQPDHSRRCLSDPSS